MGAKIVLCKCPKNGGVYGMRIEEQNGDWVRTWAFKINESKGKREKYDQEKVEGSLTPTESYPGCPYCGGGDLFVCGCGKLSCYHGGLRAKCAWCGDKSFVFRTDSAEVGGDRF
jgi:hypothetical protein